MVTSDDNNNDNIDLEERIRRQREALTQTIKEHPGLRTPIQGGDLAGIDQDTGEDIRKTNLEREKQKEKQRESEFVRNMSDDLLPKEIPTHISIPQEEKVQKLQRYGEDVEPVPQQQKPIPTPEAVSEAILKALNGGQDIIKSDEEPEPVKKLPDNYRGVILLTEKGKKSGHWGKAQLQCLTRPDLDNTFPDTLPPEILTQCHGITIVNAGDAYIVAVEGKIKDEAIYSEILPRDKYSLVVRDPITTNKEEG